MKVKLLLVLFLCGVVFLSACENKVENVKVVESKTEPKEVKEKNEKHKQEKEPVSGDKTATSSTKKPSNTTKQVTKQEKNSSVKTATKSMYSNDDISYMLFLYDNQLGKYPNSDVQFEVTKQVNGFKITPYRAGPEGSYYFVNDEATTVKAFNKDGKQLLTDDFREMKNALIGFKALQMSHKNLTVSTLKYDSAGKKNTLYYEVDGNGNFVKWHTYNLQTKEIHEFNQDGNPLLSIE